ncbi:MAG: sulfite exporter TauE/SafE family protein [Lachnospiraceae bacterium]|nr:sulfite exporter TauE/SafE family protein [Lachnospiraceae bacterium]
MIAGLLAGFLSGIISGMGIGGGAILIPVLTMVLGMGQKEAQFINLVYFIPTAVAALYKHSRNGNIEKSVLKPLIIFGVAGSAAGAFLASGAGDGALRVLFGIFLGVMGIFEIIKGIRTKNKKGDEKMRIGDFIKLKEDFIKADTEGKIDIYINADNLTQFQYRELLKEFPLEALGRLEMALNG